MKYNYFNNKKLGDYLKTLEIGELEYLLETLKEKLPDYKERINATMVIKNLISEIKFAIKNTKAPKLSDKEAI